MKIITMAVRNSHWIFLKSIAMSTQAEESILMKTASYIFAWYETSNTFIKEVFVRPEVVNAMPQG